MLTRFGSAFGALGIPANLLPEANEGFTVGAQRRLFDSTPGLPIAGKDINASTPAPVPIEEQRAKDRYIDRILNYYVPPGECVLGGVAIDVKRLMAAGIEPGMWSAGDEQKAYQQVLTPSERSTVDSVRIKWASDYPKAPQSILFLSVSHMVGAQAYDRAALSVIRPLTDYDPILDKHPAIHVGDPMAAVYEAALRIFFPDWVYETGGAHPGHQFRNGKSGSLTPFGPFPYWEHFISDEMIDFAEKYIKTPGSFGKEASSADFNILGAAVKAGATGASTGNVFVGVGTFLVSVFSNLFGGDPEPPQWLKTLMQMKGLREKGDGPSFTATYPGAKEFAQGPIRCVRAIIKPHGQYDLIDGYTRLLKRFDNQAGGGFPWLALLIPAAAIAVGS